ncbi:hypothetical protein A2U01_0066815, partial [Trifolium medium]|nr:hypothetical protein [Trifolium medium]
MQAFSNHTEKKGYGIVPKPGSPICLLVEGFNRAILQTLYRLSSTSKDSGNLGGHLPRKRRISPKLHRE